MIGILHISDTHFGTEMPNVVQALQELAQELNPTHLVVSGDITQRAKPAEFAAARQFFDSLAIPKRLIVPGNHDISLFNPFKRLFMPYRDYCRILGAELEPVINEPAVVIVGVNTTRRYRHINGEVSTKQIQAAGRRLRESRRGQLRIVVTHQPSWVVRPEDRKDVLRGGRQALIDWAQCGADLVLGGHIHLPYVVGVHEQVDGMAGRCWVVQAGTAVSSRTRREAGNAVGFIRFEESTAMTVEVERWELGRGGSRFVRSETQKLDLDR